ncbi:MAG: hypothetical protein Q8R11_03825 [bacterium]|nr:hypothetical protein [bacterium]
MSSERPESKLNTPTSERFHYDPIKDRLWLGEQPPVDEPAMTSLRRFTRTGRLTPDQEKTGLIIIGLCELQRALGRHYGKRDSEIFARKISRRESLGRFGTALLATLATIPDWGQTRIDIQSKPCTDNDLRVREVIFGTNTFGVGKIVCRPQYPPEESR